MTDHCTVETPAPKRQGDLRYLFRIVNPLLYVFPFSYSLCYHTIVLREQDKNTEKEGAENAERVLRKLLSPRGQMTLTAAEPMNSFQKEGAEDVEGVL